MWEGSNGERLQSHLRRRPAARQRTTSRGLPGMNFGIIVGRHYKDEDTNRNGQVTEYDVLVPQKQVVLNEVEVLTSYQNEAGGCEIILHPASESLDFTHPETLWTQAMESDGDLVAIMYLGGRKPVITACVNHIRPDTDGVSWAADSTDGEIAHLKYNTTELKVDSDGNVHIDLDDTAAPPDRSVIIRAGSKVLMTIRYDDAAGETRVELGSGTLEKAVLAEALKSFWDSEVAGHTHTYDIPLHVSGAGPTGAAVAQLPDSGPNNVMTDKVLLEK